MPFLFEMEGRGMILFSHHGGMKRTKTEIEFPPWRLWVSNIDGTEPFRIDTKLPPSHVECSGQVCMKDGGVQVTFIGGILPDDFFNNGSYKLYKMAGPNLRELGDPVEIDSRPVWTGFETQFFKALKIQGDDGTNYIEVTLPNGYQKTINCGQNYICRLSPVFNSGHFIVISFENESTGRNYASLFDLDTEVSVELKCGEEEVYKANILREKIAFTKKVGEPEKREIWIETFKL